MVAVKTSRGWGLNRFRPLRLFLVGLRRHWLRRFWGMDIHPTTEMSLSAQFDRTFPKGVHVGAYTYVAFDARVLTHDMTRGLYLHTRIGKNCFIGGRSLILPGVRIGDDCVVGAGSIVTKDLPPRSLAAGNPARILKVDIEVGRYGRFVGADETQMRIVEEGLF